MRRVQAWANYFLMRKLSYISPQLQLKVSKRARRMALRLDNRSRIMNLVVPPRFNEEKAFDFVKKHRDWIRQTLAELPELIEFVEGTKIPIFGHNRRLHIIYDSSLRTTDIILKHNEIIVITNQEDPTSRIIRFLKKEALNMFTQMAQEKAALINKKPRNIQVRDTKSRWGSCGSDKKLSFSWRLIFAPYEAMDYVIAHEVAHLSHMNHGKRFWELCEWLSEDYEYGKEWMRLNGHELMRYAS